MVSYLCHIAGVSRSGYYAWLKALDQRMIREERDWPDYKLIHTIFNQKNQKAGFRTIQMFLENHYDVKMNHKKILRLMKMFNLVTKVRRNCLDNAPMESFFGHLKDEVDFKQCKTFEELHGMISKYIEEYNTQRYQYGLKKMTPEQFRGHLLAVETAGSFF